MIEIINTQYEAQAHCNASLMKLRLSVYRAQQTQKNWRKEKAKIRWEDFRNHQNIRSMIPDSFVHITIV